MTTKLIVPTVIAAANPTLTDDRANGMHVGFRWLNTVTPAEFVCTSDATGAAVWTAVGSGGGGGGGGGGGPIIQVKTATDEGDRSTSSTSYVAVDATNVAITITPTNSANKIRVRFVFTMSADAVRSVSFTIKRGSTFLTPAGSDAIAVSAPGGAQYQQTIVVEVIEDAPATLSPVKYELWWKTNAGTAYINYIPTSGYATILNMIAEEVDPTASGEGGGVSVATIQDQKSSGTHGGGATAGSWETRDLNTIVSDIDSLVTLPGSNKFKPIAGTYLVSAFCVSCNANSAQARIYNVTDSVVALLGATIYAGSGVAMPIPITGVIVTDGTKEYRVEHQVQTTTATYGRGYGAGFGTEVYSQVTLTKI